MKFVIAFVFLLLLSFGSDARPPPGSNPNSPMAKYYRSLTIPDSPLHVTCCDESDCRPTRVKFENGTWFAYIREIDEFVEIPENRIITDKPHPSGSAVVCWMNSGVLCFVPPEIGG